jgi:hypothetical protein
MSDAPFLAGRLFAIGHRFRVVSEHPYRDPGAPSAPRRAKAEAWAIAVVVLWVACVARALAVLFDHSLTGPLTGLSVAIAVIIPIIAVNARVLAGRGDDEP